MRPEMKWPLERSVPPFAICHYDCASHLVWQ